MKTIRINANHAQESFDNQPAITNNGDSKETSILFESKTINIKCLVIDKDRNEIVEMFYSFLQDIICKNEYSDKNDFCKEEENTPILWSALCKYENKYNRVFEGVDIYFLANNLRETFDF